MRSYIDAYTTDDALEAGLGYYRSRADDIADVQRLRKNPIPTPVLAIGGRYAMGSAVADGLRTLSTDVTGLVLERSGHYPAEQEPEPAAQASSSSSSDAAISHTMSAHPQSLSAASLTHIRRHQLRKTALNVALLLIPAVVT